MMAKRANPFLNDFIPQSKVHIGDKQVLVNKEQLKKVYEKTLGLLFKGAKKLPAELSLNNNNNDILSHNKKDNMKQLIIGKNGTLQHSGDVAMDSRVRLQLCCGGAAADACCAYCEVPLCAICQRVCGSCQRPHCARCSLVGFDLSEMCVSCYI